jgi:hypothetical protein
VKTDDAGVGWTDCPDILGYEMSLVTQDADFGTAPAMAVVQDTLAEVIDFELSTYEVEVEVETICEGE